MSRSGGIVTEVDENGHDIKAAKRCESGSG